MKTTRQREILDIVEKNDIETQEQLLDELRRRGLNTTQATISRDIKQLHLVKELGPGGIYKYAATRRSAGVNSQKRLHSIFREGVVSFDAAQNIVVLKTMPGLASAAGAAIDGMEIPELVGSLAGDDTAILIMRTSGAAEEFCEQMRDMLK